MQTAVWLDNTIVDLLYFLPSFFIQEEYYTAECNNDGKVTRCLELKVTNSLAVLLVVPSIVASCTQAHKSIPCSQHAACSSSHADPLLLYPLQQEVTS